MKMKKIFLLFSMITVLFSLTACSNGQGEVEFSYTDTDIIYSSVILAYNIQNMDEANKAYIEAEGEEVFQTALSNFETTAEECGEFRGYRSKEDGSSIMIDLTNLDTTKDEDVASLMQFLSLIDVKIEETGEKVSVTLTSIYEKRNVRIKIVYEEDKAFAYGGSDSPYKPNEITTTPEYTTGEKIEKAALNTLMGMGTVFIVLIFISLIIGQFGRISKIVSKRNETIAEDAVPSVVTMPGATVQNPMDDKQLVAVITAAVIETASAEGSSDKLVVRSIKKAKRSL